MADYVAFSCFRNEERPKGKWLLHRHICPSVSPHVTTLELLNGSPSDMILESYAKIWRILIQVKIVQMMDTWREERATSIFYACFEPNYDVFRYIFLWTNGKMFGINTVERTEMPAWILRKSYRRKWKRSHWMHHDRYFMCRCDELLLIYYWKHPSFVSITLEIKCNKILIFLLFASCCVSISNNDTNI
jgi:hypothetical protein